MIGRSIRVSSSADDATPGINTAYALAVFALLSHVLYAKNISFIHYVLNLSLSSMTILISAILVLIFVLASFIMPIKRLGIIVFPVTAMGMVSAHFWDSTPRLISNSSTVSNIHIVTSILALSLLGIATIQALIYIYQEYHIKKRSNPTVLMVLPPLQSMEQLLFRLIAAGFVLLTLTLLSGAIFSQQIFGHAFAFKHHTVLAIMGWLVYLVLLYKRVNTGLRGSRAVIWTIVGFIFIQLGYFGTKFVIESLQAN